MKIIKKFGLFLVNITLSMPLLLIMLFTNQNKELTKLLTLIRSSK